MRAPRVLALLALFATSASQAQAITSNTTWSGPRTLDRDVRVDPGVTLTISAGSVITAATTDAANLGTDTSRVELIVQGTLVVNGTSGSQVTFTSAGSSAGSWTGLRVESGGSATLTEAIVEEAVYGVDDGATASVTGGQLRANTYGLRATAGTLTVSGAQLSGNTYGAYGSGGGLSLDHVTLVGNTYAVYSASASGSVAVTNSVVTNNSSYGLYRSTSAVSITNSYDDVWGNGAADYSSTSAGTGSFSANPLFVGAPNYRLTSNSPARKSDSTAGDLGALPYVSDATVGLVGTLWSNTTLATATMLGDVTIPAGVTVTVPAGVTLTAATTDQMQSGNDTSRVELIVKGTLSVTGTSVSSALFTSAGASAGAWTGVRVDSGGTASITNAVIEEAVYGVDALAGATLTGGLVRTNTYGLRAVAGTLSASGVVLTGNTYGAYGSGGTLSLDHVTAVSNTYAVYSASASGTLSVTNSVVTNNSSYGLYRSTSAVSITNTSDDVWGNGTADYSSTSAGTGSFSSNPLYVGAPNYRLTSNSPARKSDSTGGDLGALPYVSDATVGLLGTLWTNTTLSTGTVLGDLVVPSGVTVTLPAGVTLTAATTDQMQSGNDTSRVELIVRGALSVTGSTSSNAVLTSAGTSAGAWTGVRVEAGGTASIANATIEEAVYGLDAQANTTLSGGTLRGNTYGLRAVSGALSVSGAVVTGNSYGAYGSGGTLSLDHVTLVSNTYAVYSASASGTMSVTNSIVTNNSSYGLYRSTSAVSITNTSDDVWGNGTANYSSTTAGTGSLSANPLYVGAPNYRLTSNSPARKSDSTGGDLGALPYVSDATSGLIGSLWTNTTLATGSLLGDLIIPAGVTVTVPAGVTLTAATTDQLQSGNDTSRIEIIVRGTLNVTGTAGSNALFTSAGTSAGAWTGLRVETGGTLTLTNATVEEAVYGVDAQASATLSGGTIRTSAYGLRAAAGTLSASGVVVTGNTYGAYGSGGGLSLDHDTLVSNTYAVYSASASGSLSVTNSVVTNNSSYGLYRSTSAVAITNTFDDVWGNGTANYSSTTPGTGSFRANPLYVGAPNYRLTSNSPARKSDSTGGDLGALPYASDATVGLLGTLWVDTTLATATLLGDLTVAPGVTVTLPAGVTLTAATTDQMQAGNDTSRVELIVHGTLSATGTPASPAVLTSAGTGAGSWTGVRVEAPGTASLTGVAISEAVRGLDVEANTALTDSTLTGNTYGVSAGAGTGSLTRVVVNGNTYGAYGAGGGLTLDHVTLVSNTYAVYSGSASGSVSVTSSIVTNNSSYGLYRSTSAAAIANSYDDVWGNGTANYSSTTAGTGSISANPLYVGAPNYRLTSNSPARKSDSTGGDMGALPYVSDATVGLLGTVWANTSLSTGTLIGDLTVAPGVTLTLPAGATLTAASTDQLQAGNDTSRVELIVNGTLQISGTPTSPVTLTGATASAGSWTGVRVNTGGAATIANAVVSFGQYCLDFNADATVTASRLTACTYGARSTAGLQTINFSVFDADTYGLYGAGGSMTLDHLTLSGDTYGLYSGSASGALTVTNSIFRSCSSYGMYRSTSAVSITNSYDLLYLSSTSGVTLGASTLSGVDPLLVNPGAGDFHLQSTSPARGAGTSGSDLGAFPFAVGAVDHVVVSPSNPSVGAGGTATFSASAYDLNNTVVPGATFTWSAVPAAGTISAGGLLTAACTLGPISSAVSATASGKSGSASVTIVAGPLTALALSPATATVKSQATQVFTVTGQDACGNTVSSPAVTWSLTAGAGAIDSTGKYTAGCTRGAYTNAVTATSGSITGHATVTVAAGALTAVNVAPASATLSTNASLQFNGTAADGCGNALTSTLTWSTSVPGATITQGGLFTAGGTPGTTVGGVTAQATDGTTTKSASSDVTVTGGPVDHVVVSPTNATVPTLGTTTFTAQAYDAQNVAVPGTVSWSVVAGGGSLNASGTFTAGAVAGTFTNTVRATISGVSAFASVVVQPGPVSRVVVTPSSVTLAPGGTTTFTAQAYDANNNAVASTFTWSASPSAGTITAAGVFTAGTSSGTYPGAVTARVGAVSGSANVTVNPGALSQLSVTPLVATVQAGGSVAFTATGRDGNGNAMSVTPAWSVVAGGGRIASNGLFTAGTTTGTYSDTVRAESNGVTAFATVTVMPGPLLRVEINPPNTTLAPRAGQQFTASGRDAFGNSVATAAFTWSANPAAGTVNAIGLFTAGANEGDWPDAVTATSGALSAQAAVHIAQPVVDAGVPDAGVGEADAGVNEPIHASTGCGCGAVDGLVPFALVALLAWRRRR